MELSITLVIIIVTSLVSFGALSNQRMKDDMIFYPPAINRGQWYRFFSHGLIHGDLGHLLFNMYALYVFGVGQRIQVYDEEFFSGVEYRFIAIFGDNGKWIYLLMYVLALAVSSLPTYSKHKNNYHYRSLGASGAVSAVVFTYILMEPVSHLGLIFIPIYIVGFLFGFIYLFVSGWLDKRGSDNINHSAHIFGALFGIGFTIIACRLFSDHPVLQHFIDQVKNIDPSEIIKFGRSQ